MEKHEPIGSPMVGHPIDPRKGNPMPRETAEEFAKRIARGIPKNGISEHTYTNFITTLQAELRARDLETAEECAQWLENRLSVQMANVMRRELALPLDPEPEAVCPKCKGEKTVRAYGFDTDGNDEEIDIECPSCGGTGKQVKK